ncbi:MAG TPA: alkaline phosphatase family protein [Ramlibacter sp.]|jgi:predicted AlkP superfamily pyrophosphatase or phosphodiesterase|uniref:alkaline phosphatase family protein n=1 Tax=Ramlibacter sp. TaxID=1917967 RepID=UPI002D306C60|nr:alkaline phosphatase family protein [Ramlibacter sp.]HZY18081.1 alkaline phosphatase family protein [Ramlibacter sp.]
MRVGVPARLGALLLPLLLAACAAVAPAPAADKPRLLVLLVVDGLPQRQVTAYREQLAPDGFARFLDRGAWYSQAHYGHAFTVTAAGHATVLTGAAPHRTGIIANEWRDLATGAEVYNTGDTAHRYIGHATNRLDGTSPRNLQIDTVGDVLRQSDARAKVIGISGKDRGAILPAGHRGTAYMYMASSGRFASSTYYMQQHPQWVEAFNAGRPADRWFKQEWKPLLPEAAYARSLPDSQPWFGPRGGKLPMMMGVAADEAPGPAYYGALLRSPFADQLSLEFARAAIRGEQLGQDDVPDILVVSLSGHDYVNHAYSAESRLSHDHLLQLDRLLQSFFQDLDALVGRDRYLAVLTADHGFMPAPETSRAQGLDAGRLPIAQVVGRVNAELEQAFGVAPLVQGSPGSALVVDRRRLAERGLDLDRVAEVARRALLREPAIAAAYTRRELEAGSLPDAPFFRQVRKTWHPKVSGDVQYVLKPYWMVGSSTSVATHGSPYPYDTQVPILLYGPRWVRPGQVDSRVEVVDIAPTVAGWLGLPPPPAAEGRPLPLP